MVRTSGAAAQELFPLAGAAPPAAAAGPKNKAGRKGAYWPIIEALIYFQTGNYERADWSTESATRYDAGDHRHSATACDACNAVALNTTALGVPAAVPVCAAADPVCTAAGPVSAGAACVATRFDGGFTYSAGALAEAAEAYGTTEAGKKDSIKSIKILQRQGVGDATTVVF